MKKKSALFLLLIGGTMLSGCIGNPKLEEDTIGEIISEKDPVYDYLQGYVDNVSLVKEKDDGDSKTVWVKTTTEFDNFTYEGSYVIDCGLYSKNGNKEWDVNMATQTSLVAQQVRLQQWAEQIRDCQSRPKRMDVETWCAQNNLTKANYYYRLRRVREVCLEQVQGTAATAFVELPVSTTASAELPKIPQTVTSDDTVPLIRIKNTKGLSADIFSGVSPEMLRHLIGAFSHVE